MNYLAHGYRFLDDPYFLAGTALPDWLSVADRSIRVRRKRVEPFINDLSPDIASVARGVMQHHADDARFHNTLAFTELSLELTVQLRQLAPSDQGFRPSFLGHILVELLLDATIAEQDPAILAAYYSAMKKLDIGRLAAAVSTISGVDASKAMSFVPRFCSVRFLYDYAEDAKLVFRLNQVLDRVRLASVPPGFIQVLPSARQAVRDRQAELLNQ